MDHRRTDCGHGGDLHRTGTRELRGGCPLAASPVPTTAPSVPAKLQLCFLHACAGTIPTCYATAGARRVSRLPRRPAMGALVADRRFSRLARKATGAVCIAQLSFRAYGAKAENRFWGGDYATAVALVDKVLQVAERENNDSLVEAARLSCGCCDAAM